MYFAVSLRRKNTAKRFLISCEVMFLVVELGFVSHMRYKYKPIFIRYIQIQSADKKRLATKLRQ
jgi:NADH:ubiquinone oxidoreductase subunit K